jgi:hypothetical protein
MNRAIESLRRALGVILAFTPLLAGADLCTIGAVTGRAGLACAMEGAAYASCAAPAPTQRCSHCAPAAPVKGMPRSHGPTCCDLRPEAEGVAGQPVLTVPLPVAHPALVAAVVAPGIVIAPTVPVAPDDGRAPPGDVPVLTSPRGPPLV